MAPTSGRRAEGPSAGLVSLCLATLLGGGLCLTVAFLSAPALGVTAGLALAWATGASVAAGLAWRRAGRAVAQMEKLSGEMDVLSRRLLAIEQRPGPAPGPDAPRPDRLAEEVAEVTAEIGLLGGIVRELAVTVAAQDGEIARLKERAAPAPAFPPSAPAARPVAAAAPAPQPVPAILPRSAPLPPSAPLRPFVPEPALPGPETRPASDAAAAQRQEEILTALTEGGLEVHLQPIVSLPQRKVAFYEALARLSVGGARLTPAEFMPTLERHGRTTELDRLMLARVTAISRQLAARGSAAAVAYALSPSSLFEPGFLRALGRLIEAHPELAGRLILALPQRSLRSLDAEQAAALAALRERILLALDRAVDLRFDGPALAAQGIAYVKVPADLLLGRSAPGADLAAEDLAAALARVGLRLIAEGVERESDVPDLIDLDLPLAQGSVFSPPRVVRPEVLSPPPEPGPPEEGPPVRRSFRDFLRRAV
ncbi:EAL domain-containing protein [Methylobacterium nodulans]|uniref:Diguanylate phosphodiesterase n=1 Tax=Methylobacterium nodulans (strain LMG 21967 / CNCM I-2342 / ORS 2060) TaxID=460265 RepID=B8IF31_METNO|nr:EAL domain-containing protein [Methylobacterium nodulans]ACL55742.1 diguanylate phosphodiesterase [Methylobacterium nodulans ORS 2060]